MKNLLLALSFMIACPLLNAQTELNAGDIVFVGFDCEGTPSADPDGNGFYFVTLVDIPANYEIYFTDNAWDGNTMVFLDDGANGCTGTCNKDGEVKWTAPASGLPAGFMVHILNTQGGPNGGNVTCPTGHGTVATLPGAGKLILQQGGDALYAYRLDTNNEEVFLTAITNESFSGPNGDLPTGLTTSGAGPTAFNMKDGTPNVHVGAYDYRLGTTFNTDLIEIRDALYNASNWLVEYESGSAINDSTDGGIHDGSADQSGSIDVIDTPADMNWSLSGTALPVELLRFDAQLSNNEVLLEWSTASELNSDYFAVERRGNDTEFKVVAEIAASGNSTTHKQYSALDAQPLAGINYYRLKQVDLDGTFTYYPVKTVDVKSTSGIRLFPNPVVDKMEVNGDFSIAQAYTIISQNGAEVKSGVLFGTGQRLDLSSLDPGMYILKIGEGDSAEGFQFLKQ